VAGKLVINVDGGARGNPGPAAIAAVAATAGGEIVAERGELIGSATNNVAEYRAMLLGIELARELEADELELVGDSELIVRQLQGDYKVKQEHLRPLHARTLKELMDFPGWTVRHVRRDENAAADALVNSTLDAA